MSLGNRNRIARNLRKAAHLTTSLARHGRGSAGFAAVLIFALLVGWLGLTLHPRLLLLLPEMSRSSMPDLQLHLRMSKIAPPFPWQVLLMYLSRLLHVTRTASSRLKIQHQPRNYSTCQLQEKPV